MTLAALQELALALRKVVSHDFVISDSETARPYECDGLPMHSQQPALVVLPESVQELKQVVALCRSYGVPIVSRGAGTGLSAGATPIERGVVVSLARMDQILEIDPQGRTARVQPGVRNISISQAAKDFGLYYAPDPSSQIACSIGGNVAENSGGVHCLKYGLTVHNVIQLKVLTAQGDEVTLGSGGLDSYGFDLLALLTGSEGLLGIVTEITVRLLPEPETVQLIMAAFDDITLAADTVGAIIAAGIIPAGLEMMDSFAIQAAEDFCQAGYPRDAQALLLCELDGGHTEVQQNSQQVTRIFAEHSATHVHVSQSEEERLLLWQGRKSAFPAVGRLSPDYYCMDGTIPRGQLAKVLTAMTEKSEHYGLRVANVFHAGDGNLHPLILFDASKPGELQRAEEFGAYILELCLSVGGTITGEHGVGLEKIRQMPLQFSDGELALFHGVKDSFDPEQLLNPGKGIPSLKYCQEYRATRVLN